ncbi:hypothetical protein [Salinarimonas soli]|jgi:hypothetical protein|uniref:Uncharacterized protein n=1 Tax=Salinarimonas soli TaxID=1638099 RepID=A0A5B2VC95_9HYPH|nr:hypothetical protein [Salinarimonas soli]KAA2236368.1 hypothetical protein F0L46_14595 [Salinarimonas soli]
MVDMTKEQIDDILDRVRTWPPERQADAAAVLLRMEEQDLAALDLTDEEIADLEEALREAEREEPVPDHEMKALFDRYRLP